MMPLCDGAWTSRRVAGPWPHTGDLPIAGRGHDRPLCYGALRIDPPGRVVAWSAQPIASTARQFDLLVFLAQHAGQVFGPRQRLDRVRGFDPRGDPAAIGGYSGRLREKIERDPDRPQYVRTRRGVGDTFDDRDAGVMVGDD
jgi:two-component system response regulator VicR